MCYMRIARRVCNGKAAKKRKSKKCVCECVCVRAAHWCNVWDVRVEHCPSVMYEEDIEEGKGLHLHVGAG